MVKVQWRVVILATVVIVGWLSSAESTRRKVIIHIPHLHHGHKHSVRHVQKGHGGHSHGKDNGKGKGHVHKHHHHYYEDEHGGHGESSHSHVYEEPGHHHHHPPPAPSHHHHHSHPPPSHHSHSSHYSHPVHHHHSDHHGHGSHHTEHHRHPDHLDDLDHHHHHHLRTEESMYSYDHHHPEHSHHRVHHYTDHHHPSTTRSYDCMEICERCKMKAHRHRYSVSRGNDVTRSGSGTPLVSQVVTAGSPPAHPVSPAPTKLHQGYLVTESQQFKPMLAPGELSGELDSYGAGYAFPKPLEVMSTSGGKLNKPGRKPVQYQDQVSEFDSAYADFPEFVPDTRSWYNETYFFGKHEDPGVNVVGYHRQRGQQLQQHSAVHYADEGTHGPEEGKRKERGRDLRFLNRHRYETTNR